MNTRFSGANVIAGTSTTFTTHTPTLFLPSIAINSAIFTDEYKQLVTRAVTGTGNAVLSASPTLTGTVAAANLTLSGTLGVTGLTTTQGISATDVSVSSLTPSLPVFTNSSNQLVSRDITGSGNVVLSASPTLTGTTTAANLSLSGTLGVTGATTLSSTLGVTGVATFTAQPIVSTLTALQAVFTDASKGLVSKAFTGTGDVVLATSPILVTPDLGTPSALVGTNITGTAPDFTAGTVTTNANLSGDVSSSGNSTSINNDVVSSAKITNYSIIDEDVSSTAAIAYSKLALTNSIATTDIKDANVTAAKLAAGILLYEVADEVTATADQRSFPLSKIPSERSTVKMYINGVRISKAGYSLQATTTAMITYSSAGNGGYALVAGDRIQFDYATETPTIE
jgi:hypothetical protein